MLMLLHLEVAINLILKRDILKDLVTINLYLNLTHAPEKKLRRETRSMTR